MREVVGGLVIISFVLVFVIAIACQVKQNQIDTAFDKACYDEGKVVVYIPSTREKKCLKSETIYWKR